VSLLQVALESSTLVVAVDPGKVMNRVWVSDGSGLLVEPVSLPVSRDGIASLEEMVGCLVCDRPATVIAIEATGSLHRAWASELERRHPGAVRMFAPSETKAGRTLKVGFSPPILSEFYTQIEKSSFNPMKEYEGRYGIKWNWERQGALNDAHSGTETLGIVQGYIAASSTPYSSAPPPTRPPCSSCTATARSRRPFLPVQLHRRIDQPLAGERPHRWSQYGFQRWLRRSVAI
jgi:hypothetical protein